MSGPERPESLRVAIKLSGASSGASKRPLASSSSTLGKRPRPKHGFGGDSRFGSDDDEADGASRHGHVELISAFGADGAELVRSGGGGGGGDGANRAKKQGPLTIERQPNRDWRTEARSRRGGRASKRAPPETSRDSGAAGGGGPDKPEETPIQYGLTFTKKGDADSKDTLGDDEKKEAADGGGQDVAESSRRHRNSESNKEEMEKEAVAALLGQTTDDLTKTKHVIERMANGSGSYSGPGAVADAAAAAAAAATEDDVFRRDFRDAPDTSTLEEYEAMPVEEFGAALLRGMGWNGEDRGPKVKQVKRRPNQLGLGAKELKGAEDLGAWNHKVGSGGSGSGSTLASRHGGGGSGGSGSSSRHHRPPRLHDYRRDEEKRREKRDERYRDSYKAERDRERDERRSNGHRHYSRH